MVRATTILHRARERRTDLAVLALLSVWVGALYHRVLGMWWTADDPMVLWYVHRFGPSDYFFDPETWRSFNAASLTPWMHLSFDADLAIFGLSPGGYYLHQLIALVAAAWALYFCLRFYVSVVPAAAGALGLAASPAMAEISGFLATRHYPEGLVFACVSFALFVASIRRRNWRLAAFAAIFYCLALTAKEIYAPLPLMLVLLPEGELYNRLKRILLFVPAVAGYVWWRGLMLDSMAGGYRDRLSPTCDELSAWANGVVGGTLSPQFALAVILVLSVSGSVVLLVRSRPDWRAFWVVFGASAIIPVIPVLHVYSPRHSLGPAILVAVVFAMLVQRAVQSSPGIVPRWIEIFAGALALVIAGAYATTQVPLHEQTQRIRAEGEEVLRGDDPRVTVATPAMPYWHFFGLLQLRHEVLNLGTGPGVVNDLCLLDPVDDDASMDLGHRVVFDPASGNLVKKAQNRECRIDEKASLSVDIEFDSGTTVWRLGPYSTGRYTVLWAISENSLIGIDVPAMGSQRGNIAFEMGVDMVVAYQSLDGWTAISPRLAGVPRAAAMHVRWSR